MSPVECQNVSPKSEPEHQTYRIQNVMKYQGGGRGGEGGREKRGRSGDGRGDGWREMGINRRRGKKQEEKGDGEREREWEECTRTSNVQNPECQEVSRGGEGRMENNRRRWEGVGWGGMGWDGVGWGGMGWEGVGGGGRGCQ